MDVFEYGMECPVVFGPGSIDCIGERAKMLGANKVFLVTGPHIYPAGVVDPAIDSLKAAGLEVYVHSDVKPDPLDDACEAAAEKAREFGADCVVGIGGGSPQDTAKCVSILLANPEKSLMSCSLMYGLIKYPRVPLIICPTASGSGSEVTRIAVVSDHTNHAKDAVLCSPDLAIFDPNFTMSASPKNTAASGFDCLSHTIEASTAFNRNPWGKMHALEAMKLIVENLPKCYDDGSDKEARVNMAYASNLAGIAFNNTSVTIGHAVAHEIGGVFGIPHGFCCAITGSAVARNAIKADITLGYAYADAMGIELPENATTEQICDLVTEKLHSIYRHCGAKTLQEYGISREDAVACAEGAIEHNIFWNHGPAPMDVEKYREIIGEMWDVEKF
ncbi:MAG: iron-containing alcohol dehydrogenase [Mogibacterium sp.]|nr:iron-containing alcohol dehydrogenase [Mogibacterium sp.]